MNLIAYSDSDESENDAPSVPQPTAKPVPRPAFQKVVDRSNPGKIKLNLPGASQPRADKDDIQADAPPAKRARIGGGAFSGFNAMLPAPKKANASKAPDGATSGKRGLGKGLGAGVNLKTGAEPAFRREPKAEEEEYDEHGNPMKKQPMQKEDFRAMLNLPPPKSEKKEQVQPKSAGKQAPPEPQPEVKPAAQPTFMPMSVARGNKKKKPMVPRPSTAPLDESRAAPLAAPQPTAEDAKPPPKPKVSLFSISQQTETTTEKSSNGHYEPLYGDDEDQDTEMPENAFHEQLAYQVTQSNPSAGLAPGTSKDLTSIASELNLSAAERRQLFGRKGHGPDLSSARIVDFNTDTEYAHNELLRQQGETVQHNALKSITGTGKNSLRSLVNVATTQKDALEEHIAQGRRNKKEAGNKYGW